MSPKKTPIINDFRAGELTPRTDARVDIKAYYRGCRILEGMMPIIEGGVARVPGTYYVRPVRQTEEGWNIRVTKSGSGAGTITSNPAGINCGIDCYEFFFDIGGDVILTATPDASSIFIGWSGDGVGSTTRTITMNGNKVVNAEFMAMPAGMIGWYKIDEGAGLILYNSVPAGANKLPNLDIVVKNANFWSQVSGFGYWDISPIITSVYKIWTPVMYPFPNKSGTVIVFAKEGRGVPTANAVWLCGLSNSGGYIQYKNHPTPSIGTMHCAGVGNPSFAYPRFVPYIYNKNFVDVLTHDTASTIKHRVKYKGDSSWSTYTDTETNGFNTSYKDRLYIGDESLGLATYTWKGIIGDVMIWNVLLTDAEIDTVIASRHSRWGI